MIVTGSPGFLQDPSAVDPFENTASTMKIKAQAKEIIFIFVEIYASLH